MSCFSEVYTASQATAETEARMPSKLLGAEDEEKQDLCGSFSQNKEE